MTLLHLYLLQQDGVNRTDALAAAARVGRRSIGTVNDWEHGFLARGKIKPPEKGRFQRTFLLELDEGIQKLVKQWMLDNCGILSGEANKTAEDFRKWINKTIMPKLEALETEDFDPFDGLRVRREEPTEKDGEPPVPGKRFISLSTATAWLKKLGCEYHGAKKGLYFDGHDDPETLKYRNNDFLPQLFDARDHMDVWIPVPNEEAEAWGIDVNEVPEADRMQEGDGVWVSVDDLQSALADLSPDLQAKVQSKKTYPDGKKALLLYQDESIFRG